MEIFRKKILILFVTSVAAFALFNVSVQFGRILDCFPGLNASYLLVEEFTETAENSSEKSGETLIELDFLLEKEHRLLQNLYINHSVSVFLHSVGIPPHPHFERATPPPEA